uniref:lamin tail domain-containing protein n=1 Tax=Marivita sp. TaxID=2003365 RepID=UPI0025C2A78A
MSFTITGVIDGPLPGGLPKAIQLFALEDIADLSIYQLGSPNNGNLGGTPEFDFPAVTVAAGTTIYVASESVEFANYFGFAPDYTSNVSSINGDDAIELVENGVVEDVFGEVGVDGSGEAWEYLDGWASRNPSEGRSTTFTLSEWDFSGPDALDGATSDTTSASPFPMPSLAMPTALFISEYVEGSSFNKAIEIYNGTGSNIDLAAGNYTLELYSNGSPTPSHSFNLAGTIADGDVFVLANSGADAAILALADETGANGVINFNGDDAIVLRKDGAVIDAFGQIGVD